MDRLEEFAGRMSYILHRCDGGKNYPWKQAANDMERILAEMNTYRPIKPGRRLILTLLKNDARGWINNWRGGSIQI